MWVVTEAHASDELGAGMGLKPPIETAGTRPGWSAVKLCRWMNAEAGRRRLWPQHGVCGCGLARRPQRRVRPDGLSECFSWLGRRGFVAVDAAGDVTIACRESRAGRRELGGAPGVGQAGSALRSRVSSGLDEAARLPRSAARKGRPAPAHHPGEGSREKRTAFARSVTGGSRNCADFARPFRPAGSRWRAPSVVAPGERRSSSWSTCSAAPTGCSDLCGSVAFRARRAHCTLTAPWPLLS